MSYPLNLKKNIKIGQKYYCNYVYICYNKVTLSSEQLNIQFLIVIAALLITVEKAQPPPGCAFLAFK